MSITNTGRDHITSAIVGGAVTAFTSANAYIGVGSGTTAFAATQSVLVTPLTSARKAMDVGYPAVNANELTFRSTFGTTDAEGAWQEWGVFNASAGGTMLNRKVESLGTKPSATQTWQFTVTITLTVPAT
jgi:hypothetical protein